MTVAFYFLPVEAIYGTGYRQNRGPKHRQNIEFLNTAFWRQNESPILIKCPFYTSHRVVLFAYVETILRKHDITVENFVKLLLYGHSSLNESENKNILLATLDFINKTKRFA